MKWGRKKSSPSAMITRVFPVSWFSKFKHKGGDPATDSVMQNSSLPARWKDARFHSVDNGAYWSLSFRKERIERNVYDDEFQLPVSSFKTFGFREMEVPGREGFRSYNEMVFDKTKMKEKQQGYNILPESGVLRRKKPNGEDEFTTPRKKDVNHRRSRKKISRGVVRKKAAELGGPDDGKEKCLKPFERNIFPIEPKYTDQMEDFQEVINSRNRHSIKTNTQTRSAYKTRRAHSRKMKQSQARAYSAKTECRIRVLEDMKKARVKLKKMAKKERVADGGTIYDSFAMVKSSFNPQQDFRDSMVEMISAKGIRRPEELEELLACYLTLNCDRYHDLIIKIFQQVWFEMNRAVF